MPVLVKTKNSRDVPRESKLRATSQSGQAQTLNEEPQPQVLFTLGLLNLNPEPSMVSM
jgi:hypothetical protein